MEQKPKRTLKNSVDFDSILAKRKASLTGVATETMTTVVDRNFFRRSNVAIRPYLVAHRNAKKANISFGTQHIKEN